MGRWTCVSLRQLSAKYWDSAIWARFFPLIHRRGYHLATNNDFSIPPRHGMSNAALTRAVETYLVPYGHVSVRSALPNRPPMTVGIAERTNPC